MALYLACCVSQNSTIAQVCCEKVNLLFNLVVVDVIQEPECKIDADCRSMHACIGEICQNPCLISNPCRPGQECVVEDTLPIRTMACICPDGFYIGDNGECVQGST